MSADWQIYEEQIYKEFKKKFPDQDISFNQQIEGRFSKVSRQIDILIKVKLGESIQLGIFDCKMFSKKVDVKVVDSMIGFMDDLNANYGGLITTEGFTEGAKNRAAAGNINLKVVEFESPEQVVEQFMPSLDFSKTENSMYISLI